MTGTAMTEAAEFAEIYDLEVVEVPTNVPVSRRDEDDEVYRSAREKYDALIELIDECRGRGQPVLVGTVSIEKSESVAALDRKSVVEGKSVSVRVDLGSRRIIKKKKKAQRKCKKKSKKRKE